MSNQEDEFKAKPYDFSRPVPPHDKDSVEPSVRSMLSSSHSGEIENSFPLNQKVDTLLASQAWFATLPPRSKPSDPKVVHAIASDRRGQAVDTVKKQRNSDWEQLAPKFKPLFKYDIFEDKAKVKNQLAKSIIKILEELSCIRRVQYFYQLLILIYVPLQGLLQTFDLNLLFLALELANMLVSALNNGCTRLLTRHSSLPLRKFLTKVNYRSLRFDLPFALLLLLIHLQIEQTQLYLFLALLGLGLLRLSKCYNSIQNQQASPRLRTLHTIVTFAVIVNNYACLLAIASDEAYYHALFTMVQTFTFNGSSPFQQDNPSANLIIMLACATSLAQVLHCFGGRRLFNCAEKESKFKERLAQRCFQKSGLNGQEMTKGFPNPHKLAREDIQLIKLLKQEFPFLSNFSVKNICNSVSVNYYISLDHIIKEDEIDDCALYFLSFGKLQLVTRNQDTIKWPNELKCFGHHSFFTQQPRSLTVQAKTLSRVYKITRSDFIRALDCSDGQSFQEMQHRHLFGEKRQRCLCCNQLGHYFSACKHLTFTPDRFEVIIRHLESRFERQLFLRKKKKQATIFSQIFSFRKSLSQMKRISLSLRSSLQSDSSYMPQDLGSQKEQQSILLDLRSNSGLTQDCEFQEFGSSKIVQTAGFIQVNQPPCNSSRMQVIQEEVESFSQSEPSNDDVNQAEWEQANHANEEELSRIKQNQQSNFSFTESPTVGRKPQSFSSRKLSEKLAEQRSRKSLEEGNQITRNSTFQAFDQNHNPIDAPFIKLEIDQMRHFEKFFTGDNASNVIRKLQEHQSGP